MPVTTKAEALDTLARHHAALRQYGVQHYGLFGSFVRNEPTSTSDVDIVVAFLPGQKTFENFMNLAFFLEDILGRHVDLLTKESLSPHLGPRILQEVEYVPLDA